MVIEAYFMYCLSDEKRSKKIGKLNFFLKLLNSLSTGAENR